MYTPVVKGNPRAYKNWCNSKWTHVRAVTGAWQWEERFLLASLVKVRAFCLMCLVPGSLPCPPSASLGGFGTVRRRLPSASCCSTRSTAENSGGKKIKLNNYFSIRLRVPVPRRLVSRGWLGARAESFHPIESPPSPPSQPMLRLWRLMKCLMLRVSPGAFQGICSSTQPLLAGNSRNMNSVSLTNLLNTSKSYRGGRKNTHDVQLLPSSISLGKKWTKSLQKSYHIQSRIWV